MCWSKLCGRIGGVQLQSNVNKTNLFKSQARSCSLVGVVLRDTGSCNGESRVGSLVFVSLREKTMEAADTERLV